MNLGKLENLIKMIEDSGVSHEILFDFIPKHNQKKVLLDRIHFELSTNKHKFDEENVFFAFSKATSLSLKFNHFISKNTQMTEQEALCLESLLHTVKITYTKDKQQPFSYKIFDPEGLILSEVINEGKLLEFLQKGTEFSFTFNNLPSNKKMAEQILIHFAEHHLTKNRIKERILSHIKENFLEKQDTSKFIVALENFITKKDLILEVEAINELQAAIKAFNVTAGYRAYTEHRTVFENLEDMKTTLTNVGIGKIKKIEKVEQ